MIASKRWHKQSESNSRRLPIGRCFYISLIFFCFTRAEAQGPPRPASTIPVFRFLRHDQRPVVNADLPKGRLVLFVFFDPDCEHCQRAVKHMDEECADFRGASLFFVSMEGWEKIERFTAGYASHLRAQPNVVFLRDAGGGYMLGFHPMRFPSLFLYSPEHKLLDYEDNEETVFRIKRAMANFKR